MGVVRVLIGLVALFIGFDVLAADMFSLAHHSRYLWFVPEIQNLPYLWHWVVVLLIPVVAGFLLRLSMFSWSFVHIVWVSFIFVFGHVLRFGVILVSDVPLGDLSWETAAMIAWVITGSIVVAVAILIFLAIGTFLGGCLRPKKTETVAVPLRDHGPRDRKDESAFGIAVKIFLGVALLFIGFDVLLADIISVRTYLARATDLNVNESFFHSGDIVVIGLPFFVGLLLRLCFVSWSLVRTVLTALIFWAGHYLFVVVRLFMTMAVMAPAVTRESADDFVSAWVGYILITVVIIACMSAGNGIASLLRKRKRPHLLSIR